MSRNKMYIHFISFIICIFSGNNYVDAQVIENPVFDRTDTPAFRVDKVEITNDSTFVYCSYYAVAGSWANISEDAYLRDVNNNKNYALLKCEGLPFAPRQKNFVNDERCEIKLYFTSIKNLSKFDLIENPNAKAFNVYGINIDTINYKKEYKEYEINRIISQLDFYTNLGNYEKAVSLSKILVDGVNYLYGQKSEQAYISLSLLSTNFYNLGKIRQAILCLNKAILIANSIPDFELAKLIESMSVLSVYYNDIGDSHKAIDILTKSIKDVINLYGTESVEYANVLNKLTKYSNNVSDYSNALRYAEQAVNIIKETIGEQNELYVRCLSNYATTKSNLGDYDNAIKTNLLGYNINSTITNVYNVDNALFLGNISYNCAALGKFEEAIEYGKKACSLYYLNNVENVSYVSFLNNLSLYYFNLANKELEKNNTKNYNSYLQAVINYLDSSEIIAGHIAEKDVVLPQIKNNKAMFYSLNGDFNLAIQSLEDACSLSVDKMTLEYALYLENLSLNYLFSGNYSKALELEIEASNIFNKKIKNNLKSVSEFDITNYWKTLDEWFNQYLPKIAYYTKDSQAISLLYNETALFSKGFLLNTNLNIKDIILNEGNERNNDCVNIINQLNLEMDSLTLIEDYENSKEYHRIKNEIIEKENEIISNSNAYSDYLDKITCEWVDIKKNLKSGEIVIEFLTCPLGLTNDSIIYLALSLKYDYESPHMTPLFFANEIEKDSISGNYYNLVWKPLEDELIGVSDIFYSPIGVLHNIGIEYQINSKGKYVSDEYNVYRLSSSRELINRSRNKTRIGQAVLFGGINYDTESLESNRDINTFSSLEREMVDSLAKRGGFEKLNNTYEEVLLIDSLLKCANVETTIYSGDDGSEENFKKISNQEIGILHISTHGMHINHNELSHFISDNNFIFLNNLKNDYERSVLTHSFLVMSGGNKLLKRDTISAGTNDGILTALEISRMNLVNNQLVVLSACQTALGDIGKDGIYGLQRGFKKAGAKTILMSLDKVDDEATKILMVEFYKNLMNGKTKHQSLIEAQNYLRQVDNGKYDKPEYWASFIMLDGLN